MSCKPRNPGEPAGGFFASATVVSRIRRSRLVALIAAMIALTGFPLLQRWMQGWETTPEEWIRPLPGDQIVSTPHTRQHAL